MQLILAHICANLRVNAFPMGRFSLSELRFSELSMLSHALVCDNLFSLTTFPLSNHHL